MPENLLEVKNLSVNVEKNKNIIQSLSLTLQKGKVYVLFGPNGSGKTTLLMSIAGVPSYTVTSGKIFFGGKDITKLSMDKRAELGIMVAFQLPPEIIGIKLKDMLKICTKKSHSENLSKDELKSVETFNMAEFLHRDINLNFSGGEKKRSEILQLLMAKPKLLLIDEPDSGVDLETLGFLGKEINSYIKKTGSTALIITHQGNILKYIKAHKGCVLINKKISCMGNPAKLLNHIKKHGYGQCKKCTKPIKQ